MCGIPVLSATLGPVLLYVFLSQEEAVRLHCQLNEETALGPSLLLFTEPSSCVPRERKWYCPFGGRGAEGSGRKPIPAQSACAHSGLACQALSREHSSRWSSAEGPNSKSPTAAGGRWEVRALGGRQEQDVSVSQNSLESHRNCRWQMVPKPVGAE